MLKATLSHLKKYKVLLTINLAFAFFLTGLVVYFHKQEAISHRMFAAKMQVEMENQQCSLAALRIQGKLNGAHKNIRNIDVAFQAIFLYDMALRLAYKQDIKCLMLEQYGDDLLGAYIEGVKDGQKAFAGGL